MEWKHNSYEKQDQNVISTLVNFDFETNFMKLISYSKSQGGFLI